MRLGSNHWAVSWGSADPFRDGWDNVSGPDPWKPEFLAETAFYKAHRFMHWNRTNFSDQVHWADRTQKGASSQKTVAYEWMIDFCNRQKADAWITVPHRTFEEQSYWTNLAELVLAQLDPTLKLYIEYSNETWNYSFTQAAYCRDRGVELGLDDAQYRAGFEFHVYAAVRLFERFEVVWGADNPRLVKVVSGQAVNTWMTGVHLEALADSTINPNGTKATAYGIAPYFGNGATNIEEAGQAVASGIERARNQAEAVAGSGLKLIAYEGGQHVIDNADAVNRNPLMYDHYGRYLRGVAPYLEEFIHYNHSTTYRSNGAFGAKEGIGQPPSQAHKYRALVDFAGASPEPVDRTLVPFDALWRFSEDEPPHGWAELEFDDGAWEMQENHSESAVYLRREFNSDLTSAQTLTLTVRHDKAFVAYLNGTEILNVAAGSPERVYQLDQHAGLLRTGGNVLAIKLHIDDFDKTDLSINPELSASGRTG